MSNHRSDFIPPMRNGIGASTLFLPKNSTFDTIYEYLCHKFPHINEKIWLQRFHDHLVFSQMGQQLLVDSPYLGEQHIYYYRHLDLEIEVPFQHHILFENEHFLVVDKPHFLTVSPTGQYVQQTLLTRLKKQSNNPNLTPIHRLDRDTAGLILISKQMNSRGIYQQLFAKKLVKKIYHAIAPYRSDLIFPIRFSAHMQKSEPFYTMQITDGQINSITDIQLLEHDQQYAKYELFPVTGKQHQLRVHMNALQLPLKNDCLYPTIQHRTNNDFSNPLQLLAKKINFIDPISQQHFSFSSNFELLLPNFDIQ